MVGTLALRAERKVWIRSIDVTTRFSAGPERAAIVTARYELGGGPEQPDRPLLVDGRTCPFPISRFESEDFALSIRIDGRREPLLPLEPRSTNWNGATFELDILWPPEHTYFVVPNMLPHVISDVRDRRRPIIRAHRNEQDRVLLAGIPRSAEELVWGSPLVESVLLRGHAVAKRRLVMTEKLATEFDQHQIERSEEIVNLILRFLEQELGVPYHARVAARAGTEHLRNRLRGGSCIVLDEDELRWPATGSPADLVLAHQLAAVWWGGGLKVVGRRHEEVATGVRLYLALRWLAWIEPERLAPAVERTRAIASWGFLKSRSYAIEEGERGDIACRIGLTLYEAAAQSSLVVDVLRALTREAWGKQLSVETFTRRFGDAGVSMRV